ncbi:GSCFA domain-containing protein [Bacteroides sp. 519]|uniref:GSCFA domain-containing protein n=1 Tax=Bacteroides sp. 519 TaxID=2302937 RepID=UPI0013D87FCF|nr:GSCFA domain-containing protein [Bacteroides sp. 519]NDV60537.1 GSCFA domain protein [Bacteroides sp. 519]
MEFRTTVDISKRIPPVGYQDNILLMGSCFAEGIGKLLIEHKFCCNVNPFGILYNPSSISTALKQIMNNREYNENDLFYHLSNYHSYMHHGSFSASTTTACLSNINARLNNSHLQLPKLTYLFITFGTAWIYTQKNNHNIVSNCHKVAAKEFIRSRLTVQEIVTEYKGLIEQLLATNPVVKLLFTVSPIRHIKDGLHQNQLSKSTLLLAIDELQKLFPEHVFYFPSYEIVMDELRDYRFYADDMLHPSNMTIQYIWERLTETLFSKETKTILKEYESIHRDINHKPFYPDSEEYKRFLEQLVLKINQLKEKYPNFDVENELQICLTRLKK